MDESKSGSLDLTKSNMTSGQLISDTEGRSRFIDNNLWSSVSDELRQPIAHVDGEDTDEDDDSIGDDSPEFLLGLSPGNAVVTHLHPNPETMWKLWSVFLENVNPMSKIIHYPSLQEDMLKACKDLDNIPKGLECLMFAIYLAAVGSMPSNECENNFGDPKHVMLARYRVGVRRSLARARFLGTGDFAVLQAYTLYLLTMRDLFDSRTVWALSGVAMRIAQCMGVHRDGTALGLPPFETEMRRRVWWQVTILDFRSAELTGSGRFGDFNLSDTKVPTNCNDTDIWPGMKDPPVSQERPTEMITCLLRCEFGAFWKEKLHTQGQDPNKLFKNTGLEQRDELIDELQHRLEVKFLRYCDLSNPLQFMASIIGRSAVNSMRLMSHHPRRWENKAEIPESERQLLWHLSTKLLESDNLGHSTKGLRRYLWHTNVYFQWQALVYILGELKTHTLGEEVDSVWLKIDEVYENHPAFITDFRKPLHIAVGSLCLKAWEARMKARDLQRENGTFVMPIRTPGYIEMLRQQRRHPPKRKSTAHSRSTTSDTKSPPTVSRMGSQMSVPNPLSFTAATIQTPPDALTTMSWDANNVPWGNQYNYDPVVPYDPDTMMGQMDNMQNMDWTQWDNLIQDFEMSGAGGAKGYAASGLSGMTDDRTSTGITGLGGKQWSAGF